MTKNGAVEISCRFWSVGQGSFDPLIDLDQSAIVLRMPRCSARVLSGASAGIAMREDTASDLLRKCVAARRDGAEFPTVWNLVLKGHALVVGRPIQEFEGERVHLKIRLITGQWLVFDSASKEYIVS